jgi:predicted Zn finger-like uncharacterized protein
MRIVCPSCQATYEVPERLIDQAPRRVCCARCGHEWVPRELLRAGPPAAGPLPPQPPAAAPLPPRPPAAAAPARSPTRPTDLRQESGAAPPRRRVSAVGASNRVAVLGWVLSVLVLAMLGGAAVAWRGDVMAAWPPSQRVYAAVGLF